MPENLNHIAAKLHQGDKNALSSLLDDHYYIFHSYALKIIGDKTISKEIVLDTFTNLWINRSKLSKVSDFRSYIYSSIRNGAVDYIRKFRRSDIESLSDNYNHILEIKQTPEDIVVSEQELSKINEAIDQLPPRCKEILYLVKEEKLKYKEVAKILGISERTVENHIATAISRLALQLGINIKDKKQSQKLYSILLC